MIGQTSALRAYPKELTLSDGITITLKPMISGDADALLQFFSRVPPEDRHFLKEDVTSPEVINRWAQELDYRRVLPLLCWVDGRVVADASLHRHRSGAREHTGEVRIVVDSDYRNLGLGTALLRELASVANEEGIEHLFLEAVADKEDAAIRAAEYIGFVRAGVLRGFAKDLGGHPRDLILMEMPLGKWLEWWSF